MAKKLSVSEFISDKQLSKIEKIIEKSANTDGVIEGGDYHGCTHV